LGRVFFAREAAVLDDDSAFRALSDRTFDPEARALLAPGPGAVPAPRASRGYAVARVTKDEPETLVVETATSAAATLVVTRSWDAGWEAWLDGARVPLRRCDLALMAALVPAGEHALTLVYRPAAFRAGAALSGASVLVLVGLVLAGRKEDGA
ncbi:MAG: YfhO family protein, partial [Acidobacteriota bacterium]